MTRLTFWEKPGCAGNARQRALLSEAGHEVQVRDLLSEAWTAGRLREFFDALPVAEWFNRAAPAIKRGEVVPAQLEAVTALELLLAEPLLIRRPLMEAADGSRMVGFDSAAVDEWIGLVPGAVSLGEGCAAADSGCPLDETPA